MTGKTDNLFEFKLKFDGVRIVEAKGKNFDAIKKLVNEIEDKFR